MKMVNNDVIMVDGNLKLTIFSVLVHVFTFTTFSLVNTYVFLQALTDVAEIFT